uniref:NB-ARC domain-containing protein n=1 Tax=Aegilops tauschii TaxID=37682 RepID=R7W3B5_AEGTA
MSYMVITYSYSYNKGSGRRNVMGDLIRISRRAGVVSVWGTGDNKSTLVKEFRDDYRKRECIIDGWVDVAHPFILKDFYKACCSRSIRMASDYNGYGDYEKVSRNIFLSNRAKYNIMSPMSQNKVSAKIVDSTGVTSVWGIAGVGKSTLVGDRCARMSRPDGKFAWVDVPDPFDLVEFSRLLLLDFHQRNLKGMEAAAIGIMDGEDPIQGCREIMRQDGYIVIIDGLRSTYHWDLIETVFLSQPTTEAKIVVITAEERIAKHCVKQQVDQMVNVKCAEDHEACEIFEKQAIKTK